MFDPAGIQDFTALLVGNVKDVRDLIHIGGDLGDVDR
jgi:hypothetical protein